MGKLVDQVWSYLNGGWLQLALGIIAIFSPVLIWILSRIWQNYKNKEAYKESKDEQVEDAKKGIRDNLSKDGRAAKSAENNDKWAQGARKKKEK